MYDYLEVTMKKDVVACFKVQ